MSALEKFDQYDILPDDPNKREKLIDRYKSVRNFSENLASHLIPEDMVVQSMPDVSPTKWHLAHTSWFFETFILIESGMGLKPFHELYQYLFNSYYVQAGERWMRPARGLLSRPSVKEVIEYRKYVDEKMLQFLNECSEDKLNEFFVNINIGLHHEQQHQELMLTDIKHVLSLNPLRPVFAEALPHEGIETVEMNFDEFEEGIYEIGYEGKGFFYDNEKPRHKLFLKEFAIADRLVTNSEYIEFIDDGGYENPLLWLSDGWSTVEENNWNSPLYWEKIDGEWFHFTLTGFKKVDLNEPVTHVSFYEADAFARWRGKRLPTEAEWEVASRKLKVAGNFVEDKNFHPVPLNNESKSSKQFFGDVWEWTSSPYTPYPGYKTPQGAIGEYNGKFMANQYVLRGGSCATSISHIRNTYRNFFYPHSRWQFMGIRLATDLD
ncbi:MAG: ergothioneine biosynthesis protein EgtB [Ignavibacteria bacterium]|nr:MAG: ergothioneine biosynthesis protein EgtB [Ignavibacteria bacterium]